MSDTQPTNQPQPSSDKSKYIRTYAKDVAALAGGQGIGASVPAAPTPPPKPAPSPAPATAPAAVSDEEREATLTRLRQKVEESRAAQPPPPPPMPRSVPPPPPPAPRAPQIQEERPSPIHTYKSDFAEHIDEKGAASFSVLAAEQDARSQAPAPASKRSNAGLVVAAIALVLLGGAGLGGAAWYVIRTNVVPGAPLAAPSLIFADEQVRLSGSGPDLMSELAALANEPLPDGNVIVVYLSETSTTEKGGTIETPLAGGALIRAMRLPSPDILLRNITSDSTVGVVRAGSETRPFFVFGVSSYERTFAGMLAWERSLARDLETLYPARGAGELVPTGDTATIGTSTPVAPMLVRPADMFTDAVVANHDVRVLRDTVGQTLMLYGYVGKETLILARDEAAFTALLTRLAGAR